MTLIGSAEDVVLVDAFPGMLNRISSALDKAARRGVRVAAKTYAAGAGSAEIDTVVFPDGNGVIERWPGECLNVVVDGAEFVLSFVDRSGTRVHQGVWSASPYLAWAYHSALASEIGEARMTAALTRGATREELSEILAGTQVLRAVHARGYRTIRTRLSRDDDDAQP